MRNSKVLITDRLRKKEDGKARVFYHPENVPFGTPVAYQVMYNGNEIIVTDSRVYALAYADGMNHLHVLGTHEAFPLKVCFETENFAYMEDLCPQ